MEIALLASGSQGNAILVRGSEGAFLIDAGLSARQIAGRLAAFGVSPSELAGLVVTHEHIDHVRGAGALARKWGLPIWTNRATREAGAGLLGPIGRWHEVEIGAPFELAGVRLEPFSVPHDAADPFGLLLENGDGYRVGLATDMGFVTRLVRERMKGVQGLILEFNHELDMLLSGPYPWPLKQRIRGKLGHLSNEDAAGLLAEVAGPDLEWVVCAHISQENNEERIVLERASDALNGCAFAPFAASQDRATPRFGPGGPLSEAAP
ncbi:MAG: MBL fold metallo-hydrolase [Candidatus Tectomicrobia bacterium]|uniref:MBL fold metallo-hydrolase n=1 Tax=Tectimicrobiota bacterium TaxID=2528274 RepID=A0A932I0C9_UNCTE|nr:MBL fold metallo-hydrolase [Candidatus Tectomicrobia bacterium]